MSDDKGTEDWTIGQSEQTRIQDQDNTQFQSDRDEPTPPGSSNVPPVMTIEDWLEKLRSSDRAFYNIMAMEVWSLAKSMDSLLPGFWNRFMTNRRSAMQEFVERRRQEGHTSPPAPVEDRPS
jgi:hypothetical protein